jgi:hypothetical protein
MCPIWLVRRLRACAAVVVVWPAMAGGQAPGLPVLQNAFANPGLAVAADFGGGSGQSFLGAAAALGLGSGRFQVSGAAGASRANGAVRGVYGGRLAGNIWTSSGGTGSLGVGAFAGLGGAPRTRDAGVVTNPALLTIPAGISVGYRRPMGASRGISAYVSPMYNWMRATSDSVFSSGSVRVALGLDFAFSPSLCATVGGELGGRSDRATRGGINYGAFGAAISFVPGRR